MSGLRISKIVVKNFKSLVDFEMDLPKFSCLIGLNGAGKTTVLQFIDFLSQLMRGKIDEWLNYRGWKAAELRSNLANEKNKNIEFDVHFDDVNQPDIFCRWRGTFNPNLLRCTSEEIEILPIRMEVSHGKLLLEPSGVSLSADNQGTRTQITFDYQGSILSQLRQKQIGEELSEFRAYISVIHSLELLAPGHLRQRTRSSSGTLGLGGQNLASFLHEMSDSKRLKLVALLRKAYPRLQGLEAKSLRSGWKQLEISENYRGRESGLFPSMKTEARHINDGMLRMIAILAELQSENSFLLFDEIENGINPELVEFIINMLVETRQQVLVTTHSPMILNYLDDDVAKSGVIYLYKTAKGLTKSIPFFSIPSLEKKLVVMGPGEAFVDTNLTKLAKEIAEMTKEEA